ncbi:uncharacterized protein LOC143475187 [Brachyhypopomus gauderio]|uniref:uncharacterized protein LOC143475187 n=1 Tax=Brachyhypopomus gauderio TaxID=698409 RepID=UPI004042762D
MMWWSRRFWLLLTAILTLRDAESYREWNKNPVHHSYDVPELAYVDQPEKVTYLPYQAYLEDFSVASMQGSSVTFQQDLESDEVGQLRWDPSSEMGSSKLLVEEEPVEYQSMFQGGEGFPGVLAESQMLGTSGNSETLFEGQTFESLPSTPEFSRSFFQEGYLSQGSLDYFDSYNGQGFPSPYTGAWVDETHVQSDPIYEGNYRAPYMGQSMYIPSEMHHPFKGVNSPSRHQGHPQRHVHPLHSWPVSKPPSFLPQVKVSLSSLAGDKPDLQQSVKGSQQSGSRPPYGDHSWVGSTDGSQMWGSTTSHHTGRNDAHSSHSFPGHMQSQNVHKGKPPGPVQPSKPHVHSHKQGPGVTTSSHHTGRDDAHTSHSFPGHMQSQNVHKGKLSGPVQPSKPHAHSHMQGPGVTTSSHHSGRHDSHSSHSFPGHMQSQNVHKGKPPGPVQPSKPHVHSHKQGPGVTTSSHHTGRDDAHRSHSFPGHMQSQNVHKGKPSGPVQPSKPHVHSHMQGPGVTTSTHQTGKDDSHRSHSFPGPVYPQAVHEGKLFGPVQQSKPHVHSHMQGPGVTTSSHQTGRDDAHRSHSFPGHVQSQNVHKGKPSGPVQPSKPHVHSHMQGPGVTTSTHQTGKDDSHRSHSFPGPVYPQAVHEGKLFGPVQQSKPHAHSHMQVPGVTASSHQTGRDDAHRSPSFPGRMQLQNVHKGKLSGHVQPSKPHAQSHMQGPGVTASSHQTGRVGHSHSFPGPVNSQAVHGGKPSGSHLHSEQQGHSHMPGTGMTSSSHQTATDDAHKSHGFPGHVNPQVMHEGKPSGSHLHSEQQGHSHMPGTGMTSSSHQTATDDAHKSHGFPGHVNPQVMHEGKPSGSHLHSEHQGHSHMPGTGMTSSSHQTATNDAHKSHGFPGHVNPQVMHESKPSGSHLHSEQHGHAHMPGTGMTSSSHQTATDDAHKSHGFPGHVNPQVMHESKPSGSHLHSERQGHSHMPGTGMTSSSHQTATDDAHKSHGFPGHVNPQVMHEGKPSGSHLHSEYQGHSHMPGTGMTSSSHQTATDDAHKSHGFPGHVNPQVMHEGKPSGSHLHSEQQGHSHMPGTGMTSSSHQTATDDAHKSHGFPGHVNPQVMHESKPSGSHLHSEQHGHAHMPGTGMTSSSHQTATDDAHKSHGFPGHVNPQVMHEGKPSGSHLHSEQQGHSHMPGTGMTSSSHQTATDDANKSHGFPGHVNPQVMHESKPSGSHLHSEQQGHSHMPGTGMTSSSHQTATDDAHKSHGFPGHVNPQVMHEGKPSGSHLHSEQQGHSHMPGTGMTSSSHQTATDDAHKSHGFPGHVNPQVMHESKPSGSHLHSEQQGHSHMPGTGMTSSSHQTATDDAHKSHGFPGHVNPQVMHEGKPSGSHLHSEHQGHSHMPGTGMTSSSHQTATDDAHKSHGFPGHVSPQVMHESKPSGSHLHSEQQGHSHMPGTGMTSSSHQTATDDAHKSHGFPGHVNPQVMHEGKPSGSHLHSEHQGHSHMPGTGMTSSSHQTATDDAHKSHGFPGHVSPQVMHEIKPSGSHLHSEQQGHSHMPGTGMTSSSHQTATNDAHKSHGFPGHVNPQVMHEGKPSGSHLHSEQQGHSHMPGTGMTSSSRHTGTVDAHKIHSVPERSQHVQTGKPSHHFPPSRPSARTLMWGSGLTSHQTGSDIAPWIHSRYGHLHS